MIHDPDPVCERRRLVHVVRGQEERHAAVAQLAQAVPDEQPRGRVEAGRGLVEEEHLGRVHQGPRDHHALRLAAGEHVGLLLGAVEQPELLEQLVGAAVALARRERRGRRRGRSRLARIESARSRLLRCGITASALRARTGSRDDVDAGDRGGAARRPHARREHADGRRLPGAVRPEQAEDLLPPDLEADSVDRVDRRARIALDQIANAAACSTPRRP